MQYDLFNQSKYKFFCLGSGSSGNSYYLGTSEYGILIDAGIGVRTIRKTLREHGIAIERIHAVLITHDHADHTRAVGALGQRLHIPVYATRAVHESIAQNKYLNANLSASKRYFEKEETFSINDFHITPFEVPHDSTENVGFHIRCDEDDFVLITDIGKITDTIGKYAQMANHLVIEANYDEHMLRNGRYPEYLKERISCGTGHISNKQMAEFLGDIYSDKLKNIWLCHLSQDNNDPDLAYSTIEEAIAEKGAKIDENIRLEVLKRYKASGLREF